MIDMRNDRGSENPLMPPRKRCSRQSTERDINRRADERSGQKKQMDERKTYVNRFQQSCDDEQVDVDAQVSFSGISCSIDQGFGSPKALACDDEGAYVFECVGVPIYLGASDGVLPVKRCNGASIQGTKRSRNGCAYEAAGRHKIINEGQRNITFAPQD